MCSSCNVPETTPECLKTNCLTTLDSFNGMTGLDLVGLGIPFGDCNLILKTMNDWTSAPASAAITWKFHTPAPCVVGVSDLSPTGKQC